MCCHLAFFLLICIDDEGELITTSGSVVGFFFNSLDAAATQCNFKKNVVNSFLFFLAVEIEKIRPTSKTWRHREK